MKYLDEYRDAYRARQLLERIRQRATCRWVLMEVCGGQTHSLLKYGIDEALEDVVELIHGPGCPVCVTPQSIIDHAIELAQRPGILLCSFGDMLRVPGSTESLQLVKARGGQVKVVYSPVDAVEMAAEQPDLEVVFFAVGFETTAPATALALLQAAERKLRNFSLLSHHVRVQPAMEAIMRMPDCRVHGFLAAGHVCTVMGFESYSRFVAQHEVPVVVTGFEPCDLLAGILECVEQVESGRFEISNEYARSVRPEGNLHAQELINQVYVVTDQEWRGMGVIPAGGYVMRECWSAYDAAFRFPIAAQRHGECQSQCRAGDVLAGQLKPTECTAFGRVCTPDTPLGAPMVSSEGACAAYYRYRLPLLEFVT
jgi:hydrogenase expression/formation protein HypD